MFCPFSYFKEPQGAKEAQYFVMTIRSMYFNRLAVFSLATCLPGAVSADTVVFKGFEHTSLGAASLELTQESTLRVSDLTDSGNDGVAIALGAKSRINVGTGGDDGENGGGSGKGKYAFAAIGNIDGLVNQPIGGSTVVLDNGTIAVATEYSGVTTAFRQVEVWKDGSAVGVFPDYLGAVSYAGDFFDFPVVTRMSIDPLGGIDLRWSAFGGDRLFTVGPHGQFLGDELRFLDTIAEQIEYVSEARVTTEDFLFFTLVNVSVPEPSAFLLLAASGASLVAFGSRKTKR
jgi:hypothetical protein